MLRGILSHWFTGLRAKRRAMCRTHLRAGHRAVEAILGTLHCQVGQALADLALPGAPAVPHGMGSAVVLALLTGLRLAPAKRRERTVQWEKAGNPALERTAAGNNPSRRRAGFSPSRLPPGLAVYATALTPISVLAGVVGAAEGPLDALHPTRTQALAPGGPGRPAAIHCAQNGTGGGGKQQQEVQEGPHQFCAGSDQGRATQWPTNPVATGSQRHNGTLWTCRTSPVQLD